jgi:hypothetical protein
MWQELQHRGFGDADGINCPGTRNADADGHRSYVARGDAAEDKVTRIVIAREPRSLVAPLLCAGLLWSLVLERVGYSAVAGAGRLTGNDDADRSGAAVDGLMSLARCDLDSLPWLESEVVMLDLDGEFALEDVEELAGTRVAVAGFAGAWGHEFFDDAEVGGAD